MSITKYIAVLIVFFSVSSCSFFEDEDLPVTDTQIPQTIEKRRDSIGDLRLTNTLVINSDTSFTAVDNLSIYKDDVVINIYDPFVSNELAAYSKFDGEKKWTKRFDGDNADRTFFQNGYYYANVGFDHLVKVNLETGEDEWSHIIADNETPHLQLIEPYIYYTVSSYRSSTLRRADMNIKNFKSEGVFNQVYGNTYYEGDAINPTQWINDQGDTILIFQFRALVRTDRHTKARTDLLAYNTTADTLLWRLDSLTYDGNSSKSPPLVYEDVVFFQGMGEVYAIDIETGEQLWEYNFPKNNEILAHSFPFILDDRLIVKPAGSNLYCFDPLSGRLLWKNDDTRFGQSYFAVWKDRIYMTSQEGALYAFDRNTGRTIWAKYSPYNRIYNLFGTSYNPPGARFDAWLNSPIAIDEERGVMYVSDTYYILELELP